MKEMKRILDKFKNRLLSKFENYVIGMAIIPPALTEEQIKNLPPQLRPAAAASQNPETPPMPARQKTEGRG